MNFLSVDTATCGMSVSLFLDSSKAITKNDKNLRNQAQNLIPFTVDILSEAKKEFIDIDALVVAVGPGSFTGIRVGLSAMQGIALATNKPLIGFNNFDIHAANHKTTNDNDLLVVLESQRKETFCQIYNKEKQCKGLPFQTDIENISQFLPSDKIFNVIGDAYEMLNEMAKNKYFKIDKKPVDKEQETSLMLGQMLLDKLQKDNLSDLEDKYPAEPFYIRPPDISGSKLKS